MLDNYLSLVPIDYSWSFSNKTQKDTNYITHGIYTYPAKFIPQLASRLIREYSDAGDSVLDPMMGSGTTILESLVNNRIAFGSDINEIAYLVAKVKAQLQNTETLKKHVLELQDKCLDVGSLFSRDNTIKNKIIPENERIDYWFRKKEKEQLGTLLFYILELDDANIRDFFLVCFAPHKIIHREIPSKMLPSTRDARTGRFTKVSKADSIVYPTEYILVMEKI